MLPVGIELDSAVVPMAVCVLHSRLEGSGQSKIRREIKERVSVLAAHTYGAVARTIVHDKQVNLRDCFSQ